MLCSNILGLVSIFELESYLRRNCTVRDIGEASLRHPILAYLTLARLNGLDDDRYRKAVRATQK